MRAKVSGSERDPLLHNQATSGLLPVSASIDAKRSQAQRLGPLEIDPATRRTILAGVWLGTFLTASPPILFLSNANIRTYAVYSRSTVSPSIPLRLEIAQLSTLATLVATLLGSISSEFKSSNQASWLGTAFLLATCTFTPLYGRLCNVMGRRGANHVALVFSGLGTLGCGLSTTMPLLIASRFVRLMSHITARMIPILFSSVHRIWRRWSVHN
jgi:MFS family permease